MGRLCFVWFRALAVLPRRACIACFLLAFPSGCAAITNPVFDSVPVRLLPAELLAPSKAGAQTLPLTLLRQPANTVYRLDHGDVLGIYIEGIVGERNVPPPLHVAPLTQTRDVHRLPPAAGYPFPVDEDGAVTLPLIPKVSVRGMTLDEARGAIRAAYVKKELLKADNDRFVVTVLHPRQTRVLVLRQEATTYLFGPEGPVPTGKRNSGFVVDLPAFENDILHALTLTGGLPEFDALNEIIIYRDRYRDKSKDPVLKEIPAPPPGEFVAPLPKGMEDKVLVGETLRIPLRVPPGAPLPFHPEDVILQTGDTLFLETRDEQVFFTAGLLPPGKYVLPRDQDLDVLEAISQVHGPFYNGAFGGNNLSGTLVAPGLGSPSPSLLVVVRRVPNHGQVRILVDLRRALRDPRERILVQPGDLLLLQEKPDEAMGRYIAQSFLNVEIFWRFLHSPFATGGLTISAPDRPSSRFGNVTVTQP